MHKKARSHSAVLLLLAPVLAIGSSFLVAGSANATVKTAKTVSPTLTICKTVAGTVHFVVNGKSLSLSSKCGAVSARVGINTVTETSAPASFKGLAAISVVPNAARVAASLKTATATVRLTAHGAASVTFRNFHAVTKVISQTGTGTTTSPEASAPGSIEVCKYAEDQFVVGTFPFTITQSGATVATVDVGVNECSAAIAVASGTPVTVTEASLAPYAVYSVGSTPTGLVTASTLGVGGSGTFTIAPGETTLANFTDVTELGQVKVCKVLQDDEGSLAGSWFNYSVSWTFAPPSEPSTATPIKETGTATVQAVDASVAGGNCSLPVAGAGWSNGIPQGAVVTITETASSPTVYVAVTNVAINPSAYSDITSTTAPGTAVVTVPNGAGAGYTVDATFTNDPLGVIEVCKEFVGQKDSLGNLISDYNYNKGNSATFSVNGGATFTVAGGDCSAPIWVPAGTATVDESALPGFYISNISTVSASDPMGTRLLTGATVNPANVSVPYGGIGSETVVTYTDTVDPTQFKICKQETSSDANLSGATFDFAYSWSGGPVISPDSIDLVQLTIAPSTTANPTGLVCSGLIEGPPSVNPGGGVTPITVAELPTDLPGVWATAGAYAGNGSVVSTSTFPVYVSNGVPADVEFDPGAGINIVTFTNGATGVDGVPE